MGALHQLERRILACPYDQPRCELAAGNHQRVGIQRSSSNEIHDLDVIAVLNLRAVVAGALDDGQVVLDRHAAWVDVQLREQSGQRERSGDLVRVAVQDDLHSSNYPATRLGPGAPKPEAQAGARGTGS